MSKYYGMSLELCFDIDTPANVVDNVVDAARSVWPFDERSDYALMQDDVRCCRLYGEGYMADDTVAERVANDLRDAIWGAAGAFVKIRLESTRLDTAPYDVFVFGMPDYTEFVAANAVSAPEGDARE